jgi:hypothetical protein
MRKVMVQRLAVKDMSAAALEEGSTHFDWSAEPLTFRVHEAVKCEKCERTLVLDAGQGNEAHNDIDTDSECDGHVPSAEGPMMSYFYALPENSRRLDPDTAAKKIVHLPLCLVDFDGGEDSHGTHRGLALALTGGGMDLTWEIAEAYMRLGFLPPTQVAALPRICGRGVSSKDRWIARGCMRSFKVAKAWLSQRAERVKEALAFGVEYEAKRQAENAKRSA